MAQYSIPAAREPTAQTVADYGGSDLTCYFAEGPQGLVERQEAARLARGRAGHLVALDHDGCRAAEAEEIGRRGADRAAAADDDSFGSGHARPTLARPG